MRSRQPPKIVRPIAITMRGPAIQPCAPSFFLMRLRIHMKMLMAKGET